MDPSLQKNQIDKEYQWLSEVIPNIDPVFHRLIIRLSSIWKIPKETVIQCEKLAMKLTPGIAEGKPVRSICINNIDTKFIENNRNLLIKFLNIRYNNTIVDNNLENFLDAVKTMNTGCWYCQWIPICCLLNNFE